MRRAYLFRCAGPSGSATFLPTLLTGAAATSAMEFNQVSYFLHLADTLNFTAAARLSGVSQPSLTRAIRRLEEELGGALIYRDGKNSRLTGLGQDVETEFRRMLGALESVRDHSRNWTRGGHRVLDIAVAPTIGPQTFTTFFASALEQLPTVEIRLHSLETGGETSSLLSGRCHAVIATRDPRADRKLEMRPLFRERMVLGCAVEHPLAGTDVVRVEDLAAYPYVDRLGCELRDQVQAHVAGQGVTLRPWLRTDREDWVRQAVADNHSICILPERSAALPGLTSRPIADFALEREVVFSTVSGSTAPVEIRRLAQLASIHPWGAGQVAGPFELSKQ